LAEDAPSAVLLVVGLWGIRRNLTRLRQGPGDGDLVKSAGPEPPDAGCGREEIAEAGRGRLRLVAATGGSG